MQDSGDIGRRDDYRERLALRIKFRREQVVILPEFILLIFDFFWVVLFGKVLHVGKILELLTLNYNKQLPNYKQITIPNIQ